MASDELRVIFAGKQLEDADMLAECGVEDASTLHILMRLLGGAKKRKKKTYTKPKKQKHKHKKIKMRVLKFYKVSGAQIVQHCTTGWGGSTRQVLLAVATLSRLSTHLHTPAPFRRA